MTLFRLALALALAGIAAYTAATITAHGWGLLPAFFGAIADGTWQGQFNLDFLSYLLLSGAWVAWRHGFSPAGLALGAAAAGLGMMFLAAYLLHQSFRAGGNMRRLLLGVHDRR
jgi:hypothetical protein